ncbi:MAG: 7-cyano-7-deazaguanine synthase [bacterium]
MTNTVLKGNELKAISLLSGGLDSTLATKIIKDMGIEVIALNFTSPFCQCGGKHKDGCKHKAQEMAEQLGVELKMLNNSVEFIEIIKHPKYGYGSGANPCIDCRILKFKTAKKYMEEIGASFIITGEVVGQRPMSQNRRAMDIIEKDSGLDGLIVRPLCAGHMKPSIPEVNGWIDRSKLLSIEGRSREKQLDLVDEFKIENHACPAGGCLLTDKNFSMKIMDLRKSDMLTLPNARLFVYGRYFAVTDKFKMAVGRDDAENKMVQNFASSGDLLIIPEAKGPTAIGRGDVSDENIKIALGIIAHYCKKDKEQILNYKVFPEEYKTTRVDEVPEVDPKPFSVNVV